MLILTRKPGESLYIGDTVKVTIVEIKGNQIRVGIEAPPELRIYREEIYVQILEENKKAAETAMVGSGGLDELTGAWKGAAKPPAGKTDKPGSGQRATFRGTEVIVKRKKPRKPGEEDEDDPGRPHGGETDTDE